jgi:hypothetical protein
MEQRLAAILVAGAVGFSRQMGAEKAGTLAVPVPRATTFQIRCYWNIAAACARRGRTGFRGDRRLQRGGNNRMVARGHA